MEYCLVATNLGCHSGTIDGARAALATVGLASCFWADSIGVYGTIEDAAPVVDDASSCLKTHGYDVDGKWLPFGCKSHSRSTKMKKVTVGYVNANFNRHVCLNKEIVPS